VKQFNIDGLTIVPPIGAGGRAMQVDLENVLQFSVSPKPRDDVRAKALRFGCTVTDTRWADKCTLSDFTGYSVK